MNMALLLEDPLPTYHQLGRYKEILDLLLILDLPDYYHSQNTQIQTSLRSTESFHRLTMPTELVPKYLGRDMGLYQLVSMRKHYLIDLYQ